MSISRILTFLFKRELYKAIQISEDALEATLQQVQVGQSETDIQSILIKEMFGRGADGLGFDPIVAAAENDDVWRRLVRAGGDNVFSQACSTGIRQIDSRNERSARPKRRCCRTCADTQTTTDAQVRVHTGLMGVIRSICARYHFDSAKGTVVNAAFTAVAIVERYQRRLLFLLWWGPGRNDND